MKKLNCRTGDRMGSDSARRCMGLAPTVALCLLFAAAVRLDAAAPVVSNQAPSNVSTSSACMNGELVSTGDWSTVVLLFWGTTNGQDTDANWQQTNTFGICDPGQLITNITDLAADMTYYYRYCAVNADGTNWASQSRYFITGEIGVEETDTAASENGDVGILTLVRPPACTNEDLVVNYTMSGDAINGSDYSNLTGTAIIPAGATSTTVTVAPIDDSVFNEPVETVILTVTDGAHPVGSPSPTGTVFITDNDTWKCSMTITVTNYIDRPPLTNFPLSIVLGKHIPTFDYSYFASPSDGGDLRFADASSNVLDFEIEDWDTNGKSYAWVRVPLLTNGVRIFALLGNTNHLSRPACTTNGAVWDNSHRAVWHLNQTNGVKDLRNSATNMWHGVSGNSVAALGKIAGGQVCTLGGVGIGQFIPDTQHTYSFWIKATPSASGNPFMTYAYWPDTRNQNYTLNADGKVNGYHYNPSSTYTGNRVVADNTWHHIAITEDYLPSTAEAKIYIDGVLDASTPAAGTVSKHYDDGWYDIGQGYGGSLMAAGGMIDEYRVARTILSTNRIWADYQSQGSYDSFCFYKVNTEAPQVVTIAPTNVTGTSASMNGTLHVSGTEPPHVLLYWGASDGETNPVAWQNTNEFPVYVGETPAPFTTNITGLNPNTLYYYRYAVTDRLYTTWATDTRFLFTGILGVRATIPTASETDNDGWFAFYRPLSAAGEAMTLNYAVSGSATPRTDYALVPNDVSVTLGVGVTSVEVRVVAIEDGYKEENETVSFTLEPGAYVYDPPSAQATVTILDSDERHSPHKMKIILFGYTKSTTLNNFNVPVLFNTNTPGFRYSEMFDAGGYDLRFRDANQDQILPYEIEEWNTNGESVVWVRVPTLIGTNVVIWAWWGNDKTTGAQYYAVNGSTWSNDANWWAVWHLGMTNGANDYLDSTLWHGHYGTPGTFDATGKIAHCKSGSSITIEGTSWSSTRRMPGTVSCWINTTSDGCMEYWGSGGGNNSEFSVASGKLFAREYSMGNNSFYGNMTVADGQWHHVVMTRNAPGTGSWANFYVDGHLDQGGAMNSMNGKTYQGFWILNSGTGRVDELRIADVVRGPDWIWAEWKSMASQEEFLRWVPMISNGIGAVVPSQISAELNGEIIWTDSVPSSVYIFWGTNDGGRSAESWEHVESLGVLGAGTFSTTVGVLPDTAYSYRCCASNEYRMFWADKSEIFMTGEVKMRALDRAISEDNPGPACFVIWRSEGCKALEIPVFYDTTGTAESGLDYESLPGSTLFLAGSTSVYVNVFPINDEVWKEPSESVTATLRGQGYFLGDPSSGTIWINDTDDVPSKWNRWMTVDFTGYDRSSTLVDFPLLVVLNESVPGFKYSEFASSYGYDLRFISADEGLRLNHEIEEWNTNGDSFVWVQIPELANASDYIWAIWGSAEHTNKPAFTTNGAVWSADYLGVWHLAETNAAGTYLDSSPEQNFGTANGDPQYTTGKVAGGKDLDADDFMRSSGNVQLSGAAPRTVGLWVKATGGDNSGHLFSVGRNTQDGGVFSSYALDLNLGFWGNNRDFITDDYLAAGLWQYLVLAYDGTAVSTYLNGVAVDMSSVSLNGVVYLTDLGYGGWQSQGGMTFLADEYRISDALRSDDWIWTEWYNMERTNSFPALSPVMSWGGTILIIH